MTELNKFFIDKKFGSLEKDFILFVDNNENIWELINRKDLTLSILKNCEIDKIKSFNCYLTDFLTDAVSEVKDIEFEEHEGLCASINDSDLDISRFTDFNSVTKVIKETVNLMTEV